MSLVTSSREMRSLNRRFRGKDKPTDVLSFPPWLSLPTGWLEMWPYRRILLPGTHALSVMRQREEIKILALHGVLHLAGYDHENDNGEMAHEENRLAP